MRQRALLLCLAFCTATACTGNDAAPSDISAEPDAGSDVRFIVVDAGPQGPTRASITTPPTDLVVSQSDSVDANVIPLVVDLDGEEPDSVQLAVNGTPEDVLQPPYHYEWDISGRSPGTYELSAWAIIDDRAYPGPARTIVIDEEAFANISPTIVAPSSTRSVDRTLEVRVVASGLATTGSHTILRDGEPVAEQASSASASFQLDTSEWPEGASTIQARLDVGEHRFWSLPRTLEVIHGASPRFEPLGNSLGSWQEIDLTAGPDGSLYAALTGQSGLEVHVWSSGDQTWERLGTPVAEHWQVGLPDLVVTVDGTVYIAWSQPDRHEPWTYRRGVYAARWNPDQQAWEHLGEWVERNREHDAASARVWVDAQGVPHVALASQDWSNQNAVEVARWDRSAQTWQPMGEHIDAPSRAGVVALDPDDAGALHLVWRANFQVLTHRYDRDARQWNANAAPTLDGFAFDAAWRAGRLTIPVFDRSDFRVVESDLLAWRTLDTGAVPSPASIGAVGGIALDQDDNLVQTWLEYADARDLYASRWIDGRWEALAARPIQPDIDADVLSSTAAASLGRLYVGFIVDEDGTARAYVRELTQP